MEDTAHIPGDGAGKGIIPWLYRDGIDRGLVRIEIIRRSDKSPYMLSGFFWEVTRDRPEISAVRGVDRPKNRQRSGIISGKDEQPVLELPMQITEV